AISLSDCMTQVRSLVTGTMRLNNIEQDARFYFVHSYYVEPKDENLVAATCEYGVNFCTAIHKDNLFATQFHPEKSHTAGLQLLKNFVEWNI
ncbi:glutamine amidotransferase-related protein, partial [Acinetobacter baumannii]|uniref:glutamine amidotransferase-related protein n=1 Tax=Acinetobacter baumannii TaxID=470 RepID=UPI003917398A